MLELITREIRETMAEKKTSGHFVTAAISGLALFFHFDALLLMHHDAPAVKMMTP
jgi:hypothetical protein